MKKFFITTIVLPVALFAQAQTDSVKTGSLDEIVITATKSPKKLSETGKVLTVITQQQLQQNSSHSLGEILNEQTGIIITGSTATPGTNQSVFVRGASAGNTLILIDGIPVYDASGISSEFDINYININQVERIEILKGAQSTLYGSDAVAGVINIITKKTFTKPVSGFAEASAGTYGTINTAAGLNGKSGKFQYAAGGSYVHTKGLSSANDINKQGDYDKDPYSQYAFNASAGYAVSSRFIIRAFAQFNKYKAALDAAANTDDNDYNLKNKNILGGVNGAFHSYKNHLFFNYQYNLVNRSFIDDSTDIPYFASYQKGRYKSYSHFVEVYNSATLGAHAELLTGADFRHNSTNQSYLAISIFGPYETKLSRDSANTSQASFYTSFFIKNISGFNAEFGGRINNHSVYGWNATYSVNPSYNITAHWKIFANISSAYHVPSLYQLYSEFGNKDLKPERSHTYEAGLQHMSNKIQSRLVYFKRDIKNLIDFYTDINFMSRYVNADKQKDNGIEAEFSYSPMKGFTVAANYTYTDGKIKINSNGGDTSYFNLFRRPRNIFNTSISWSIKQFSVSARLHTTSYYYDQVVYAAPPEKFKGYYTINLYGEYKPLKNVSLFADARNVTNQHYTELPGYNSKRFNIMAGLRLSL